MSRETESGLKRVLEEFQNSLTEEQKQQFSITSLKDVESEIKEIQRRFGSEKKLRNLKKISKFLEAMGQVEQVVKVFLNVHNVVAFVWGPIKLALVVPRPIPPVKDSKSEADGLCKVAGTKIEVLERLLDAYADIGDVIPNLRQYDQLFRNCPAVREVLERYLYDILQFHRKALDVLTRPAWDTFLRSAWKTFDASFKPILDSLKRHRSLLSDEKLTAAIEEIQDMRRFATTKFEEQSAQANARFDEQSAQLHSRFQELSEQLYKSQERSSGKQVSELQEALRQQRDFIAQKLGRPDQEDCEDDQRRASEKRLSTSGNWILKDPSFSNWIDSRKPSYDMLYLHGMPGAGKTTLVSRIIDHLRSQTTACKRAVLFFYFNHQDEAKRSMEGMLRAILHQLLYQDDSLIGYFYQKCSPTGPSEFRSLSMLKDLARESLKSQRHCVIVLDGLDECVDGQRKSLEQLKSIIEWFQNIIIPESRAEGGSTKLLLAGQRDGVLDEQLSAYPNVKLDGADAHLCDIRDYAASRVSEIRETFFLNHDKEAKIMDSVSTASKRVVLDNLMEQGSQAELEDEMERFPNGLEEAYERIVARVLNPTRAQGKAAKKILGYVVCAARPLQWREIQSLFCIDLERGFCNPKNSRVHSCKNICGSFVEVKQRNEIMTPWSDIEIRLVHNTAGEYLIHTGQIRLFDEQVKMAAFCSRYLTSGPFKCGLRQSKIRDFALSGYYGFQDYATAFWHHHIDFALSLSVKYCLELPGSIVKSAMCLFTEYEISQETASAMSSSPSYPTVQQIRKVLQDWQNNGQKDLFERRTSAIRRVIELINVAELDEEEKRDFLTLNGVHRFKCPKPRCQWFTVGFTDQRSRDAHVKEHERPFKCTYEGCPVRTIGFSSQADLDTHSKRLHSESLSTEPLFPLPAKRKVDDIFAACSRGDLDAVKSFVRKGDSVNMPSRPNGQLTPLVLAARGGHVLVCQYLIQQGALVYTSTCGGLITPLGETITRQDYDFFRFLTEMADEGERLAFLSRSSPPNLNHYVQVAVKSRAAEILKDLLTWYEWSDEIAEGTILNPSCEWESCEDIARVLLSHMKASELNQLNEVGETLLHKAVSSGKLMSVKLLLQAGADANIKNDKGKLPIQLSCTESDAKYDDVLAILLEHTDNVNCLDNTNEGLLKLAVRYERSGAVRVLLGNALASGSNMVEHTTVLHLVAERGLVAAARLLIDKDTDIDVKDASGQTPLHRAMENEHEAMVQLLASKGANPHIKDAEGRTPWSLAVEQGHEPMLHLLLIHSDASHLPSPITKIGDGWAVIFNPSVPRVLDVNVAHTILYDSDVTCAEFSQDGKYLATGCHRSLQIHDVTTGGKICVLRDESFKFSAGYVSLVRFSPDGRYLATAFDIHYQITIWDIATGQIHSSIWRHAMHMPRWVDLAYDGCLIASNTDEETVSLWDADSGEYRSTIDIGESITSFDLSPGAKCIVVCTSKGTVGVWDIDTGNLKWRSRRPDSHMRRACSVSWHPNGQNVVSSGADETIKVWDLSALHDRERVGDVSLRTFTGHTAHVISAALTSDAAWLLSSSIDGSVQLWDPRTGVLQVVVRDRSSSSSVVPSRAAGYFVTSSPGRAVRIWSYSAVVAE